ncbi:MAG TPA: cob(I)yrinic acid a,c-diamide adenosyltransferase [Patescibacteria group bacterium]|nr:cob(I)yrinic acid a,c-diamide adenosyltransferase [Patescibacteria group bacterium]
MPIYTKKGDKGETGLFSHNPEQKIRISKSSLRVRAIGAIDELDSFIGLAKSFTNDKSYTKLLSEVQRNLLTIGSHLGGSGLKFSKSKTNFLEKKIDEWDKELPKLSNFILPGGTNLGAQLHVCRSATRRAEREITALSELESVHGNIKMYINRLSDFMFQFSRYVNFKENIKEEIWVGRATINHARDSGNSSRSKSS